MKKLILVFFDLFLMSCVSMGFAYKLTDRNWEHKNVPHRVNTKDKYCLFYEARGWSRIDDVKINNTLANKQVATKLREFGINLKEEKVLELTEGGGELLKNKIIERERENGYKNCDYLINYRFSMLEEKKPIHTEFLALLHIGIIKIKTGQMVGDYSVSNGEFFINPSKQEQIINKSLNKW